jgi:hypothetical protein
MGENHTMFSYIYQEFIHRKHQLPNFPAATGRWLQPCQDHQEHISNHMPNNTNYIPLPSMYQYHHIPSEDMGLNQVPTCITTSASTMHRHLYQIVHQPCTDTYTKSRINHAPKPSTMHLNHQPCTSTIIKCLKHIPYHSIHLMLINQDMNQQCISPSKCQPTCTMHPMMCLNS